MKDETKVFSNYMEPSSSLYAVGEAVVFLLTICLKIHHQAVHQRVVDLLCETAIVRDVAASVDKVLQFKRPRQHQSDQLHALPYYSSPCPTFRAPRSKVMRS